MYLQTIYIWYIYIYIYTWYIYMIYIWYIYIYDIYIYDIYMIYTYMIHIYIYIYMIYIYDIILYYTYHIPLTSEHQINGMLIVVMPFFASSGSRLRQLLPDGLSYHAPGIPMGKVQQGRRGSARIWFRWGHCGWLKWVEEGAAWVRFRGCPWVQWKSPTKNKGNQ